MFRSPSYNSFLHRDNRPRTDKTTHDEYNRLEELANEFSLIRQEIYDGSSEQNRLLPMSQQSNEAQGKPPNNSQQLQETSDRLKSQNISLNQPVFKGNYIKPDTSQRKTPGVHKNFLLIPRVHRLAGLSSELRSLSEKVLGKDTSDVSVSNMSGATELTVPSCASWDVPYGSLHCVVTQESDETATLAKSTATSEDDSEGSESPRPTIPDKASVHSRGSSSQKVDQLMEENSLMWSSNSIDVPIIKKVTTYLENSNKPNEIAPPHSPKSTQDNLQTLRSSITEGICLSQCQSAAMSGSPITVLATPTIVKSVEGSSARMLEVLQLQYFPIVQGGVLTGNLPTVPRDDESQHASRDKDSTATNQESQAVNLSKPPRHPLTKPVVKDTTDHRETIMSGFQERTTTPKKKAKPVSVAEIEALLNRENQENAGDNNHAVRFQSIPSLQTKPKKSKHRRVHSYDTAKVSNVSSPIVDSPKGALPQTFPKFQNSHEIFRVPPTNVVEGTLKSNPHQSPQTPTTPLQPLEQVSERRSERSSNRSRSRRRRSHSRSSNSSRSSRSLTSMHETKQAKHDTRESDKKRSDRSCSTSSKSSMDSHSQESPSTTCARDESLSSTTKSKDDTSSPETEDRSTCTDVCGIFATKDEVESNPADVDAVLREIRKRQIDRMISERVGAAPLGISMAEERLLQRIRERSKQYHHKDHDDDNENDHNNGVSNTSPGDVDKALDVASYRSRRHGVAMVHTLKLKKDVTPTRRMEQADMDHVERRRFLEEFRNEVASLERREKRRRSVSRSVERRRDSKSHDGTETCSNTTCT